MSKWNKISIGEFIDFNPSESIKKGTIARKIPMDKLGTFQRKINGSELSEYSSGPKFRNGDTLVAKITPCLENGKTALVDILNDKEVAFGSSEFIVLRENKNSDKKFIYYLSRSPLFRNKAISCMEGTSGRKRVNEGALKTQEILVPDLPTQQKIASVLSALDDKIELNNSINEELEAMAKTLYDYWFVQFDFPIVTSSGVEKPYKSSGGKMVYNETLKREIPEGWEVKTVGELVNIFDSKRIPLSKSEREKKKGIFPYYGATEIMDYINDFIFDGEYILLAEDGSVMNSEGFPILQYIYGKTWVNNHAHVLQSKQIEYTEYLYKLLEMIPVILIKSGSIQMKINQDNLLNYKLLVAPETLILKYSKFAKSIRQKLIQNQKQNQELSASRDWLLPMLMNGQVKVGEIIL